MIEPFAKCYVLLSREIYEKYFIRKQKLIRSEYIFLRYKVADTLIITLK